MKTDDIIRAQKCCCEADCTDCPLQDLSEKVNCQIYLAEITIKKLSEMRDLVDDKVNHHYYDTLEYYQEENTRLRDALYEIEGFINKFKE